MTDREFVNLNREYFTDEEIRELECEIDMRRARTQFIESTVFMIVWSVFLAFCASSIIFMSGCATPRTVTVEKVVPVTVVKRCAEHAPPTFVKVPKPTTCAVGKLCWSIDDSVNLAENIERLKEWVVTTWSLCAPPSTEDI